jgi:hypothetical protein
MAGQGGATEFSLQSFSRFDRYGQGELVAGAELAYKIGAGTAATAAARSDRLP